MATRFLRPEMADTVDLLSFYDGSSPHRTLQKLQEIASITRNSGYPVSGDDLALATRKEPENHD